MNQPYNDYDDCAIQDQKEQNLYLIETECGGSNAAGGGCGAPLGLRSVTAEQFRFSTGRSTGEITSHNSDEHDFDEDCIVDVKLEFRAGSCCRGCS